MVGRIAKLVGYAKAPRATFMLRHPIRGVKQWRAARRGLNAKALTGAGVMTLAVPVGLWIARRQREG